jgi:starch-binding outer membrane protein, SusD/RagB family
MKKYNNYLFTMVIFAAILLGNSGCKKDFPNPNAPQKETVLSSTDGLLGYAVGIRREYSLGATSALFNAVSASGLSTKEFFVINTGNGELAALESGRANVGGANAFVGNIWTSSNLTRYYADELIQNADIAREPAGLNNAIKAYGQTFKALGIATMSTFFEKVTTEFVPTKDYLQNNRRATFIDRTDALKEAIALLETAEGNWSGAGTPAQAALIAKVGANIDLKNAIPALIARYSLMVGDYTKAAAAAGRVDAKSKSTFNYEAVAPNPLHATLATNNTYGGKPSYGLEGALLPEKADSFRLKFYIGGAGLSKSTGFFNKVDASIPLYLPSEMDLIKAECFARQDKLPEAIIELNKVITKSADPFGVTAKLPAFASTDKAAILDKIYQNRCIELYMSGMKLEDSRRFGRPGPSAGATAERTRTFYPYPLSERDNNPNTPKTDPAE